MSIIRTPPPVSGREGILSWNFTRTSLSDADLIDVEGGEDIIPMSGRYGVWQVQRILLGTSKELAAPVPGDKVFGDSVEVMWLGESASKERESPRKMLIDAADSSSDKTASGVEFVNRIGEFSVTRDKMTLTATLETEWNADCRRVQVKITRVDLYVAKDSPIVGVFVLSNNMLEQERLVANKTMTPRVAAAPTFMNGSGTLSRGCSNKNCPGKLRCSHYHEIAATRQRRHSIGNGSDAAPK